MKKALQITIAGTLFTIEEDAYNKLRSYLDSIHTYFSKFEDNKDIVDDIEARIAEQLLESIKHNNNIVTLQSVEKVIETMGTVEKISDESEDNTSDASSTKSSSKNQSSTSSTGPKRLYRSTDDVVIAGVASGLAIYLNIDPLIMRLLFILITFFSSGSFIIVYIVAALLIPKAETAADKIQMHGGPVTLNSFKEVFTESVDNIKKTSSRIVADGKASRLRSVVEQIITLFGAIIRIGFKILLFVVGLAILIGALVGGIFVTFVYINLIFNLNSPYLGVPIEVIGGPLYYILVSMAYLLILIPLSFVMSLGSFFLNSKKTMSPRYALVLVSLWIFAALVFGTIGVRYFPATYEKIKSLPEYQRTTKVIPITEFSKLDLNGYNTIELIQGETFGVVAEGRQIDLDNTIIEVNNNTLTVAQNHNDKICIFCLGRLMPTITITTPSIDTIETSGTIELDTKAFTTPRLDIATRGVSSINATLNVPALTIKQSGSSDVTLVGTSTTFSLESSGVSHFSGGQFTVQEATITTSGSADVFLTIVKSLQAKAHGVSRIIYIGNPTVSKDIHGQAFVGTTTDEVWE